MKKSKVKKAGSNQPGFVRIIKGTIAQVMNKQVIVLADGEEYNCKLPNTLMQKDAALVGDAVEIGVMAGEQYVVNTILPRNSVVHRGNRRVPGETIAIAANVQVLLAVVTAEYLLNQAGFLESAIIAARRAGIPAVAHISKWDCIGENAQAILQSKLTMYGGLMKHISIGAVSDDLIQTVKGKTVLVVGDRGHGKTSLISTISAIKGEPFYLENNIPSTHMAALIAGESSTFFIDTPGFRSFVLQDVTSEERDTVYPEIAKLAAGCQFSDCTHTHENDCRVIDALRSGGICRQRYDDYQKMSGTERGPAKMGKHKDHARKTNYRHAPCSDSFTCKVCGVLIAPEGAGSQHRNHCPHCLSSIHVDEMPGDRASLCHGIMEPVGVWVRKGGEWAIIHRCKECGQFSSNRIAADDNGVKLMSIALRPLTMPAYPLDTLNHGLVDTDNAS